MQGRLVAGAARDTSQARVSTVGKYPQNGPTQQAQSLTWWPIAAMYGASSCILSWKVVHQKELPSPIPVYAGLPGNESQLKPLSFLLHLQDLGDLGTPYFPL